VSTILIEIDRKREVGRTYLNLGAVDHCSGSCRGCGKVGKSEAVSAFPQPKNLVNEGCQTVFAEDKLHNPPMVNLPETAILGIGRIIQRPVVMGDEIVAKHMRVLSLSFSHRLVDGAAAACFFQYLKNQIKDQNWSFCAED
jgi:pyruvate/2-oxoglutarate dehydrogenase complex dihydrolipoamide acyltransferase (E2) component